MTITIAMLGGVFLASLLGSLHCAGMCGAFVGFYSSTIDGRRAILAHVAYHLGRLAAYSLLGAAAGLIGAAVDLTGYLINVQRIAALFAGTLMVGWALTALLPRSLGHRLAATSPPSWLFRLLHLSKTQAPETRALLVGLSTTLLPCGWLYAFLAAAAGSATAFGGMITMATFWMGTVPILFALGMGVRRLQRSLGIWQPKLSAALVLVLGLATIVYRMPAFLPAKRPAGPIAATTHPSDPKQPAQCGHHAWP